MGLHWIGLYAAITVITNGRIQKESITASKKQKRHWNRCLRKDIGNDSHCFCWQQHIQFPLVCLQSYAVWMCKDAEGTCNILAHPNSIRYDDLLRGSRNTLSRKSRKFTQNSWHNQKLTCYADGWCIATPKNTFQVFMLINKLLRIRLRFFYITAI